MYLIIKEYKRNFIKGISRFLVYFLILLIMGQNHLYGESLNIEKKIGTDTRIIDHQLWMKTFSLLPSEAKIHDSFQGDSSQIVIHIQDAHCNYAAQKQISSILSKIYDSTKVDVVSLEGGVGEYDLSVFNTNTNAEVRKKVSEYFMTKGYLSGAEYFMVNNPGKLSLWGCEAPEEYLKNLEVYRQSLEYKDKCAEFQKMLEKYFQVLMKDIFNENLMNIEMSYVNYLSGDLKLKEYLILCKEYEKNTDIDMKEFPNIKVLDEMIQKEKNINFKRANDEREELIEELSSILSFNNLAELSQKVKMYRDKIMGENEFYEYLFFTAERNGYKGSEIGEIEKYIGYIELYSSMDKSKVAEEVVLLTEKIKESLFENMDQRALDERYKEKRLIDKLFNFTLTRKEYEFLNGQGQPKFDFEEQVSFLKMYGKKYGLSVEIDVDNKEFNDFFRRSLKFYEYSFARDYAFLKNMQFSKNKYMDKNVGLIITGGFHSESLLELFREKGISYVSILPIFRNKKGYSSPYFDILSGGIDLDSKAFGAVFSLISPPSLWNALSLISGEEEKAEIFRLMVLVMNAVVASGEKVSLKVKEGEYVIIDGTEKVPDLFLSEKSYGEIVDMGGDPAYIKRQLSELGQDKIIENAVDRKYLSKEDEVVILAFEYLEQLKQSAPESKEIETVLQVLLDQNFPSLAEEMPYKKDEGYSPIQIIAKLGTAHAGGKGLYLPARDIQGALFGPEELALMMLHELIVGVYAAGTDVDGTALTGHDLARKIELAIDAGDFILAGELLSSGRKHELLVDNVPVELNVWEMTDDQRKNLSTRDYTSDFIANIARKFTEFFEDGRISKKFKKYLIAADEVTKNNRDEPSIGGKGWISKTLFADETENISFIDKKTFIKSIERLENLLNKSTNLDKEDIDDIILKSIARGDSLDGATGWINDLINFLVQTVNIRAIANGKEVRDSVDMYKAALKVKLPYFVSQKGRGKEFIEMLLMNNMFSYGKETVSRRVLVDGSKYIKERDMAQNIFDIAYKVLLLLYLGENQNENAISKYLKVDYSDDMKTSQFLKEVLISPKSIDDSRDHSMKFMQFMIQRGGDNRNRIRGKKQMDLLDSIINEYDNVRAAIRKGKINKDFFGEDVEFGDKRVQKQINDEVDGFLERYIDGRRDITTEGPLSLGDFIVYNILNSDYDGVRLSEDNVNMLSFSGVEFLNEDYRVSFNRLSKDESKYEIDIFGRVVNKTRDINLRSFKVIGPEGKGREIYIREYDGNMIDILGSEVKGKVTAKNIREKAQKDFDSREEEAALDMDAFMAESGAEIEQPGIEYIEKTIDPDVIMVTANMNLGKTIAGSFCIFINRNIPDDKKRKLLFRALTSLELSQSLPVLYQSSSKAKKADIDDVDQVFGIPVQELLYDNKGVNSDRIRKAFLSELKKNLGDINDIGEIPRIKAEINTARDILIDPKLRQKYSTERLMMMNNIKKYSLSLGIDYKKLSKAEKLHNVRVLNENLFKILKRNLEKIMSSSPDGNEVAKGLLKDTLANIGDQEKYDPAEVKAQLELLPQMFSAESDSNRKWQEAVEAYLFLTDNEKRKRRNEKSYFDVLGLDRLNDFTIMEELNRETVKKAYSGKMEALDNIDKGHRDLLYLYEKIKTSKQLYDFIHKRQMEKLKQKKITEFDSLIRGLGGAGFIGSIRNNEGEIIVSGVDARKEGMNLIIEHREMQEPINIEIEESLSAEEKEILVGKMESYLMKRNTLSPKEREVISFIVGAIKRMNRIYIIEGSEVLGVNGSDEDGETALFLNRLLLEDFGLIHEMVEGVSLSMVIEDRQISKEEIQGAVSFESFEGMNLSEILSNHTFARGLGSKARIAYESLKNAGIDIEVASIKDLSNLITDMERNMQEFNLRSETGNKLTDSEKAQMLYNYLTRDERKEFCDLGSRMLLYGIQDHLDPAGNASFTSKIKALVNDMRRQTVNILVIPHIDVTAKSKVTDLSKRAGKKLKKIGVDTIILQGDPGESIENLIESAYELAGKSENKDRMPQIFVDVVNDTATSAAAREYVRKRQGEIITVVIDDVIDNVTEGDIPKVDIVKLMIVAGSVLNDKRSVNSGSTTEDLAESRKNMIQSFLDSEVIDLGMQELGWLSSGDVAGLETILNRLYYGAIKMRITRINWEEITDWFEAQNEVMSSL